MDIVKAILMAAGLVCVYGFCSRSQHMTTTEWRQRMRRLGLGIK
jgi:hypothetical protein